MKKQEAGLLFLSTLLASLSGFINALGILIYSTPVSHFTGNTTNSSIAFVQGEYQVFLRVFSTIIFFLVGGITSGYVLEEKEFNPGKRYGMMLLFIGIALFLNFHFIDIERGFLQVLAFLCGMQNGLFITYKGMTVRMTHITGGLTDMGVYIGNYLRKKHSDVWKIKFLLTLILGFFAGGIVGSMSYFSFGKDSFLLASAGYLSSGFIYFIWRNRGIRRGTLYCNY
ncbi:permease [Propionigenium maris DSM 9537]|uniref:Permease n=1 Tax=Propionigenium maris DSM 9537 TaxID=1123000 RepID=A0A9W6GL74_9FUSO|nr:YoaK family protein [Propionigenium maris]GLI57143.1 permease [Propionigenium maris DSM 9537]